MQVGTTLPRVVFMGTGALGREPMAWLGPYNWTCNFKYLSTCSTWARPKQVCPGAVTSCPDAGRFDLPGLPRYLGSQVGSSACVPLLLCCGW